MSDGHILLVNIESGQKIWHDPQVGEVADYLNSGWRNATEDEIKEAEEAVKPQ